MTKMAEVKVKTTINGTPVSSDDNVINAEYLVKLTVNGILSEFYHGEYGKVNKAMLVQLGLENEGINWGDLRCVRVRSLRSALPDVDVKENVYVVYIEEAKSDVLEQYIEDRLRELGIQAIVKTDW